MPRKSLAPAFVVVNYTTTFNSVVFPHTMTIPVQVIAWTGATTQIIRKSGIGLLWSDAVAAMLATITPLYHSSTVFQTFELWRQDSATSDPSLVSIFTPAGLIGTSAGATVMGCGVCYAFRSTEDSPYRLLLIEPAKAANARLAYSALSAAEKAPVDYLLGNESIVYARSNAYLATFGIYTTKVYDKVRKKRLGM